MKRMISNIGRRGLVKWSHNWKQFIPTKRKEYKRIKTPIHIPVVELGLATGQVVVVRRLNHGTSHR